MNRKKEWLRHALYCFKWGPFGFGDHTTCPRCNRLWSEHMAGITKQKVIPPVRVKAKPKD